MTDHCKSLSARQERFVAEYLKDANATQAYIRAGYATRSAQTCASKLLRQAHIEAAVEAGRKRLAQALEITVERMAAEYARIAFANVDDFISVDDDGRVRVDLQKASRAQRAGVVEISVTNHGKQEQRVTLKLGKLRALDSLMKQVGVLVARPAPEFTAEDRQRMEERMAAYERMANHSNLEQRRLERELREARAALAAAQASLDTAGRDVPPDCAVADEPPGPPDTPRARPKPPLTAAQYIAAGAPLEDTPVQMPQQRLPGEPPKPPVSWIPGTQPTAPLVWPGQAEYREPSSADVFRPR